MRAFPLRSHSGAFGRVSAVCAKFLPPVAQRPDSPPRLTYRRAPAPVVKEIIRPATCQTIRQSVTHLHQTVLHRHVHRHFFAARYLRQDAFVLLVPPSRGQDGAEDLSRPSQAARRLRRLFSGESALRELRPFYGQVVRGVLREEQERYKSQPTQAISLIWNLFGRREAFRTLTRFYMSVVERLGGSYYPALTSSNALFLAANVLLKSRIYRQYVRSYQYRQGAALAARYAPDIGGAEASALAVRRAAPLRETLEDEARQLPRLPAQGGGEVQHAPQLDEAQFRALVRDVARSLEREAQLERLRRGELSR